MVANKLTRPLADTAREDFAAALAQAAYAVALRHGVGDGWLDLELNIWQTLPEALNSRNQQDVPPRSYRK